MKIAADLYWFITEKCHTQDSVIDGKIHRDDQIPFGYARLSACSLCAEFGYISETKLSLLGSKLWKVPRKYRAACPQVEGRMIGEKPKSNETKNERIYMVSQLSRC